MHYFVVGLLSLPGNAAVKAITATQLTTIYPSLLNEWALQI
jgi:hypothetical protein